jgi:hypothetical protein
VRRAAVLVVLAALTLGACGDEEEPALSDAKRTATAEKRLRNDLETIGRDPGRVGAITKVDCEKITDDTFLCSVDYERGEDRCFIEIDASGEADESGCRL